MRHLFWWGVVLTIGLLLLPPWADGARAGPESRDKQPVAQSDLTELMPQSNQIETLEPVLEEPNPRLPAPYHIPKRPGHYSKTDWAAVIDATWGEGMPTEDKLAWFDEFWSLLHEQYACFVHLEHNWWDSLHDQLRLEIEGGVSKGRFCGIMSHIVRRLREVHTQCHDLEVVNTALEPGVPLLFVGGWDFVDHFGAGLTPLPDRRLLVYTAVEDHPLGLVPGDLVLGYDGVPWHELYPTLIEAELPMTGLIGLGGFNYTCWGSNNSSYEHTFLMSAGQNWHLFDTVDIQKYGTDEIQHLPTTLLAGQNMALLGLEQIPIPGVPPLDYGVTVSWGTFTRGGLEFGYIYVYSCSSLSGTQFAQAVSELMDTDGLIIDMRRNVGGWIGNLSGGFRLLFNAPVPHMERAIRCDDPDDHLSMCEGSPDWHLNSFDSSTYFDRPIAVLVGPGCYSAGDNTVLLLAKHPMGKLFGRSSQMNPNPSQTLTGPSGWYARFADRNSYLWEPGDEFPPDEYLTHQELEVDVPVWLERDDVAHGRDTVVEAAVDWFLTWWMTACAYGAGFESQPVGTQYGSPVGHVPGEEIFNEDGILVTVEEFDDGSGPVFNFGQIDAAWPDFGSDHTLHLNSLCVQFDLAALGAPVPAVTFEYADLGGVENLQVNGAPLWIGDLDLAPAAIAPDVQLIVQSFPIPGGMRGEVTLAGPVESFRVGGQEFWLDSVCVQYFPAGVEEAPSPVLALEPNTPNPFNPFTHLNFTLGRQSRVRLTVHDLLGRLLATPADRVFGAGSHSVLWDGRDLGGQDVASGVYVVRLENGPEIRTRKIALIK